MDKPGDIFGRYVRYPFPSTFILYSIYPLPLFQFAMGHQPARLDADLLFRSRLKNLEANTPAEDKPCESYTPVETWPSSGVVEFDDVTVAYK